MGTMKQTKYWNRFNDLQFLYYRLLKGEVVPPEDGQLKRLLSFFHYDYPRINSWAAFVLHY
jgi:hypothetical protein